MPQLPESGVFPPTRSTDRKWSIGSVSLFIGGKDSQLMGEARVAELLKMYHRRPSKYQAFVYGYGAITRDEINWDTSGVPDDLEE